MKVAVLDDYQGLAHTFADWSSLRDSEVDFFRDHLAEETRLAERLQPYEAVVAMRERTPFPRSILSRLPNLRLLITTGMRNASFDMEAARELGITVCGTGNAGAPTAELTFGLMIDLMRGIHREHQAVREGGWQVGIGPDLQGKTLALAGLGNLGSRVAAVGRAFGMEIIAWSQNLTAERAEAAGAKLVSKQDLLRNADVLSIHLQLSDRTRGLFGSQDLALMKPSAYIVNTSRGPIIDEAALIDVLEQGRIAGAALDVFDEEPLPADHAFRRLDNVLTTPHIGYVSQEAYRVFYRDAVEDIAAFAAGAPVRVLSR